MTDFIPLNSAQESNGRPHYERLIDLALSGAPVVTVNTRLSRYLRQRYDEAMRAKGRAQWTSPLFISLSTWVESLWHESWPDTPLLSARRSRVIWAEVVSGDPLLSESEIVSRQGIIETSYKAFSLMKEYRLPFLDDIYLTEEAAALKRWIGEYEKRVKRLGFVSPLSLPERITRLIEGGEIEPPETTIFAGFDEIAPATAVLIGALEGAGKTVDWWPLPQFQGAPGVDGTAPLPDMAERVRIRSYADRTTEVIQAARWCRDTLTRRPDMTIAFIVPELEQYREIIRREFSAELAPPSPLPWEETALPFNISLGRPLSDEPLVKAALDIIALDGGRHDINLIRSILFSPYLDVSEGEHHLLARLDARLREQNALHVGLTDLLRQLKSVKAGDESRLNDFAEKVRVWHDDHIRGERGRQSPSRWADEFHRLLTLLGWPSGRITLTSEEYQALGAWKTVLDTLSGLDDITGPMNRRDAAALLARLAQEETHQPEGPECPVQVLGTLEATSGHYFNHIWLLGCHDEALPAPPSPNPFIPLSLQRERSLPHASPEREHAFACVIIGRIVASAPRIEVSSPAMIDDREVRLSPLFKGSGANEEEDFVEEGRRLCDTVHNRRELEEMKDEECVPFAEGELKQVRGGATILRDQSACPFKAFAAHRLNARRIALPELGFTPALRGIHTHRALALFWEKVGTAEKLRSLMDGPDVDGFLHGIVNETVSLRRSALLQRLSEGFIDLERQRLVALLKEWAAVEGKRSGFTVEATEEEREMVVEGLTLKTRLDRVDRLEDGRWVMLDYKTGICSRGDWLTDRPKDPQLPLYTLSGRYDAIAFAQVRVGDCRFKGVVTDNGLLPGIKAYEEDREWLEKSGAPRWEALMEQWRGVIEKLARDFVNGTAAVDPRDYGGGLACDSCDLMALCRVLEGNAGREAENDGA